MVRVPSTRSSPCLPGGRSDHDQCLTQHLPPLSTEKDGFTHAVTAQLAVSGGNRDRNAEDYSAELSLYLIENLD